MSDIRKVTHAALAPARGVISWTLRTVTSLQRQAPGARMIGEMTVKWGGREIARRLNGSGKKPDQ